MLRRARSRLAAPLTALVAFGTLALPVAALSFAAAPAASAALVTPTTPAAPLCGIAYPNGGPAGTFETPASYTGAATPTKASAATSLTNVHGFAIANGDIYERTDTTLYQYTEAGSLVTSFPLPTASVLGNAYNSPLTVGNAQMVVDPATGDIYLFMQGGDGGQFSSELVALSPTGTQLWSDNVSPNPAALYVWHDTSGNFAVAVAESTSSSYQDVLLNGATGTSDGTGPVPVSTWAHWATAEVTQTPSGGFLVLIGGAIYEYDAAGNPMPTSATSVPYFEGPSNPNSSPGAGVQVDEFSGIVEIGSTIYDATYGTGIAEFTSTGIYEGVATWGELGVNAAAGVQLAYDPSSGDLYYFQNIFGGGYVYQVPLSSVQTFVSSVAQPPVQADGFGESLGAGASVSTSATANYFPSGSTPAVTASFDPWWQNYPDPLSLSYWVASAAQVTGKSVPTPTTVPLSWSGVSAGNPLTVPLAISAADQGPGVYLVNADLVDNTTGNTLGATCLTYSVGMAGDTLNFSSLPGGPDYGGPTGARGVALAAELGTGLFRDQLELQQLLPNCSSSPSATTCGPSALTNWTSFDTEVSAASALAKADNIDYELQIGQTGGATDAELVNGGYWQEDIQAIIEHFHTTAPDLNYVEVWNEPNGGAWSASQYVTNVLEPFWNAVQAANTADGTNVQVVGGTVLGTTLSYWQGIASAGGFAYMNVASAHLYPGYDRGFEEQGTVAFVQQLRALMAANGAGSMPLWNTEQGWWSDGQSTFYEVGGWAPQEWMWAKALGIQATNYFITEGGYSGTGTDFSLIDAQNSDLYVKPGAIGLMTVSNVMAGRSYLSQPAVGIPHATAMLFGPSGTSNTDVLAVWTDGLKQQAYVTLGSGSPVTVTETSYLGASTTTTVSTSQPQPLEIGNGPTYLTFPAGDAVSVAPGESYGTNLALASAGATATASSSQSATNAASDVIAGTADAQGQGAISSTPAWAAATSDASPWIQVALPSAETVDRVIVSTSSLGSTSPGLRDYTVQVQVGGSWQTVGTVTDEFFNRMEQISFPPVANVTGIQVLLTEIDHGSVLNGLSPSYWNTGFPNYPLIYSIEAYAPGTMLPNTAAPPAPPAPTATAGNASAAVSWTAPSGGNTITGYTVTASGGGQTCSTTGATTCTVTGLTNGTSYTFTVTATDPAGTSPASASSSAVTPSATVPSAPTATSATAGDASATVGWTAPTSDGGSPITGYTAKATPGAETCTTTGATTCTVTGLTNGTSYTFTVTAKNVVGTSAASAVSASVMPVAPPRPVPAVPAVPTGAPTTTPPPSPQPVPTPAVSPVSHVPTPDRLVIPAQELALTTPVDLAVPASTSRGVVALVVERAGRQVVIARGTYEVSGDRSSSTLQLSFTSAGESLLATAGPTVAATAQIAIDNVVFTEAIRLHPALTISSRGKLQGRRMDVSITCRADCNSASSSVVARVALPVGAHHRAVALARVHLAAGTHIYRLPVTAWGARRLVAVAKKKTWRTGVVVAMSGQRLAGTVLFTLPKGKKK